MYLLHVVRTDCPQELRSLKDSGVQHANPAQFCMLGISTQHACISEFLSDSNFFMHDQSEFQCDPFQDRPAEKGGQEWVELEAWPFEALRETFFPACW